MMIRSRLLPALREACVGFADGWRYGAAELLDDPAPTPEPVRPADPAVAALAALAACLDAAAAPMRAWAAAFVATRARSEIDRGGDA